MARTASKAADRPAVHPWDEILPPPKVGAIVAAIPPPVLGGAGFALFGTVAVIGIQTLRRVDFHDERNVIILAVSLGFAMTPTVYPAIVNLFPESIRTIISSGITLGSISAILLNLVFNVWGGRNNLVTKVLPVPRREEVLSVDQVNQMDRGQLVATFAHREKFGFPLVVAVRENTKETILRAGNARLQNSPAAEQATALVEIAKIANLRLLDIVEEPVEQPAS